MNDYLHVLSYKVIPQPIIDFVSSLRTVAGDERPKEKSKVPTTLGHSRVPQLFSFYQRDIKSWSEKRTNASHSPLKRVHSPRQASPFNVLDVELKGNSGTVGSFQYAGSMRA